MRHTCQCQWQWQNVIMNDVLSPGAKSAFRRSRKAERVEQLLLQIAAGQSRHHLLFQSQLLHNLRALYLSRVAGEQGHPTGRASESPGSRPIQEPVPGFG